MFRIIEIVRGEKPEGNCLLFGHTVESDFYIKGYSLPGKPTKWDVSGLSSEVRGIMKRKNFQRAKDLPLNSAFPRDKDWNY